MHLVDLALVHYTEKTYVENEFKIFKVADVKMGMQEKMGQDISDKFGDLNTILNDNELKAIVDKDLNLFLAESCMTIECSEKIFRHEDEERRVVYPQMDKFY